MKLNLHQAASHEIYVCMVSKVKIPSFRPKTMDYSKAF